MEEWNKDVIREDTKSDVCENENESEESDQEELNLKVTHTEAVQALSVAIEWAKQNTLSISDIITLKNIHEKAVLANLSIKKTQSKITSYFSV